MNKLDHIVYISLPERMQASASGFSLDPSILLPVEADPSNLTGTISNLSWEMIIAAILKLFAYDPGHKDLNYFRKLVLTVRPAIIEELTRAAFAKSSQGDYDLAEEILTALSRLQPENSACQLNLALLADDRCAIYGENGNEEMHKEYLRVAAEHYEELFSSNAIPLLAYYYGALFYARNGEEKRSVKLLRHFIKESDDKEKIETAEKIIKTIETETDLTRRFAEAYRLIHDGKEQEGIDEVEGFLKAHPDVWNGWFLLGWGERRLKRYKKAKAAFSKALELNDSQVDIYNELSICNLELNHFDECRENLEIALKIEPFNIKILSNFAILELKEEQPQKALEWFHKVLEIDSEDPVALAWIRNLEADGVV